MIVFPCPVKETTPTLRTKISVVPPPPQHTFSERFSILIAFRELGLHYFHLDFFLVTVKVCFLDFLMPAELVFPPPSFP